MARLFGKDYHEMSNTWTFTSKVLPLDKDEVEYQVVENENNLFNIKFRLIGEKAKMFPGWLTVVYDPKEERILEKKYAHPEISKSYDFGYTIIQYGYDYLSTDLLTDNKYLVYTNKLVAYNQYWQSVLLNSKIFIEGLYFTDSDKIRFYFIGYDDIDLRLLSFKAMGKEIKEDEIVNQTLLDEQFAAFSDPEIQLFKFLGLNRCSYSKKRSYFTIYTKDVVHTFPYLKELSHKLLIKETGEPLHFPNEKYPITLRIDKHTEDKYLIKIASGHYISHFYIKNLTYVLVENKVYPIQLPFKPAITHNILTNGHICSENDVVYLASVVAKQTGLANCYLDFSEEVVIPEHYNSPPQFQADIEKDGDNIILKCMLIYGEHATLPIIPLYFNSELIGYQEKDEPRKWFYVPYNVKREIIEFVEKLPLSDKDTGDGNSVYVYQRQDKIELLKLLVYEKFRSEWNLNLDNGLKEEFISKINLKPIVTVVKTDKIDWFEYKVEYKIHNVTLSHQEIRSFFGKNEKYLRLPDNRLVHFEDNKAFSQLDNFLKTIEKSGGAKNRLQNYNLTYLFALSKINTNLQVAGDDYLNVMFNDLLRRRAEDITSVPLSLTNVMRSYQKLGYYWLKMLQRHHLGGILADDMGLGKTLQALALLSDFYQENKETHKMSLVVCPKTLLFNWGAEIDKFHPNLTYTIYEGNKSSRSDILEECTSDIVIVSYSLVQTDIDIFKEYSFAYIILDEAQHIKNPATLKSKGVKRLEAEHRVALTGTPMENNAVELWSIFDFLMPGYLQSLRTFKKTYDDDDLTSKEEQVRRKELLAQVISPFILRRRKSEVLLELPDKQTQLIYNKMTAQQERLYLKVLNTVKESLMPAEETDKPINYINVLTILMRLRQICNHPGMIDSTLMDKINYSAKLESLVSLIQDAVENRRKLLVFSQFTSMLKIVSESLDKIGITYEYMDGKTVDRKERIERFTTDEQIRVFLLTLKVGGLGLNLTAADTVILVDPWWNPMSEDQSIDRVYRIGQTKKVLVYKLVTKGTIEEKILQLQDKKRTYFENIVENSQSFINKLTINDLKELFEYEPQLI